MSGDSSFLLLLLLMGAGLQLHLRLRLPDTLVTYVLLFVSSPGEAWEPTGHMDRDKN